MLYLLRTLELCAYLLAVSVACAFAYVLERRRRHQVYRPLMSKDEGLLFDNVSRGVPDHDSRYPARVALVVLGALAVVAGVWMIIAGNARLAYDNTVNDYNVSMGGLGVGNPGGDWWLIGWGIGLLAVGVILVVARLIIAAARN